MESRKRPRADDGDVVQAKKRALSVTHDTPVAVNGDADEPKDGDNLEMFRKDAIFRRMKQYARENERSQSRIAELERRRNACEAGLAALEASWAQLLGVIRSLATEELPAVDVDTHDVFDLTVHVSTAPDPSHFVEELRSRMHATEQLVTAFVRGGGEARSKVLRDQERLKSAQVQTECASLRAELSLLSTKLHHAESEKEQYHEQLISLEKRIDRLQSKAVAALNPSSNGTDEVASKAEEPADAGKAQSAEPGQTSRASPTVANSPDAPMDRNQSDAEEWEGIAELRKEKYDVLLDENRRLHQELCNAQVQARAASETQLQEMSQWKTIQSYTHRLSRIIDEERKEIAALHKEVDMLRRAKSDLEHEHNTALEQAKNEFKDVLQKREYDITRLREQRDVRDTELKERKTKDAHKSQLLHEWRQLAESRLDTVKALSAEVARLKSRIAAEANDEDLMTFFFKSTSEERSYVEDLKQRLAAAEDRLKALEGSNDASVDVKVELLKANKQLEEYKSIFGPALSNPENQALAEQLRQKEAQIHALQLKQKQHQAAETSLYSELERLSSAWETLDRELKSKIFDLSSMEEQIKKANSEKAKAESKYFKVLADKNMAEQHTLPLSRTIEKQAKSLEKLAESERLALARVSDLEKRLEKVEQVKREAKAKCDAAQSEVHQLRGRLEDARKHAEEYDNTLKDALKDVNRRKQELLRQEEALLKKKKEVEKQAAKVKAGSNSHSSSGSSREAELQGEVDKCMSILKCSTCRMNMRNTVITKCMHSFCRNCVNERISSRQRKCPACNLPFSQGEVQQLYFQ